MVLPISYTSSTTYSGTPGPGHRRVYKVKAVQTKPFNLPTEYTYNRFVIGRAKLGPAGLGTGIVDASVGFAPIEMRAFTTMEDARYSPYRTQLINRLYSKFVSSIRSADADLGATFAEGHQAWNMMSSRLYSLVRGFGRLNRHDWYGAAKAFLMPEEQARQLARTKKFKRSKYLANNYLEFHFGWSPLLGDIYSAMEVLSAPIPLGRFRVRDKSFNEFFWSSVNTNNKYEAKHKLAFFGELGADISVTQPNLYLASSLGLTNPAAVAWELVPFSFVVDWVYNVSDFINQYSDFFGLNVVNPYYSVMEVMDCSSSYYWRPNSGVNYSAYTLDFQTNRLYMRRTTALPPVTLQRKFIPVFENKIRRALAAVSLLVQLLPRK